MRLNHDTDDYAMAKERPYFAVTAECREQLSKLRALIDDMSQRTKPFRLSVPKPAPEEMVMAARDLHSSAVEDMCILRDDIKSLQRTVADLLEELEV